MKIKALNVYPIKALSPIPLESATLTPQGILHDRTYMLFKVNPDSSLRKLQLSTFPQCALFSQEIVSSSASSGEGSGDTILVRYNAPNPPLVDHHPLQDTVLSVPLVPDTATLQPVSVDLHGSPAEALRMGDPYDAFFSACFGFPAILVHIGSGRRQVLGTMAPGSSSPASSHKQQQQQPPSALSLLSSITSYLPSFTPPEPQGGGGSNPAWLTFTDCAPYLVTSSSSLSHPSLAPFQEFPLMPKFRPNIVVDDPAEAPFAEDFWAELSLPGSGSGTGGLNNVRLLLTANCGRCSSLNVDYNLGRAAAGQEGTLLKTLMRDRRVDPGHKYAPVFGRYAFLAVDGAEEEQLKQQPGIRVRVGDEVVVSRRSDKRTVFDWDLSASANKTTAVA